MFDSTLWRYLGAVTLIVGALLAGGLYAQETDVVRYTIATANLRECARLNCAVVTSYPKGTELLVLGTEIGEVVSDSNQWLLVKDVTSQVQGYLHISLTVDYVPDAWKQSPVIPVVSDTAREIYRRGLELGNDPRAFSKVGDCQNVTAFFLTSFDEPLQYDLGAYQSLQAAVDNFAGSFARDSESVRDGFNVASVLSPMWADPEICQKGESPLECEYRLHKPSIAIISMETWWSGRPADEYEKYLRKVVEFWIGKGVVPILGTKADNLEGDHSINAKIVKVAHDYDVPLWNFWLAVQPLPNHGLTADNFHLTYARNFFGEPSVMQNGWPMRNLTALQAIDAVWRAVSE